MDDVLSSVIVGHLTTVANDITLCNSTSYYHTANWNAPTLLVETASRGHGGAGARASPIFNNLIFLQLTLELHKVRQQLCAVASPKILIFSERELTFMFAICCRPSVCLSSVVCNARAPYSGGCNFRQFIYGIWYFGYSMTRTENFMEIVLGEPLRRGS